MIRLFCIFILCLDLLMVLSDELYCKNDPNCYCFANGELFQFYCPKENSMTEVILTQDLNENTSVGKWLHITDERRKRLPESCIDSPLSVDELPHFEEFPNRTEILLLSGPCSQSTSNLQQYTEKFHMNITVFAIIKSSNFTIDSSPEEFESIKSLFLQNCRVQGLKTLLELSPNIISLHLMNIGLTELEQGIFNNNPFLIWLYLSKNEIASLPDNVFKILSNLIELKISHNNLTELQNSTFEGLYSLSSLELSDNQINYIEADAFKDLWNLTTVNLNNNKLQYLPSTLFESTSKIAYIGIQMNPLKKVDNYLFSMKSLQGIFFDNCELDELPEHLFQGSSNLTDLYASHNKIEELTPLIFSSLQQLERLDLSGNRLSYLPDEIFRGLLQLKTLSFGYNLISLINGAIFKDLQQLRELDIQHNRIKYIDEASFRHLENLKIFNMAWNQYGSIDSDYVFSLLSNNLQLEEIDLSHNQIRKVPNDMLNIFHNQRRLQTVDLSYNFIPSILIDFEPRIDHSLEINLENNLISSVLFHSVEELKVNSELLSTEPYFTIKLANNVMSNDCKNYDFLRFVRKETNPEMKRLFNVEYDKLMFHNGNQNISFSEVEPIILACPLGDILDFNANYTGCARNCSCDWRPHDKAIIVNCTGQQLTSIPDIELPKNINAPYNQTILHLDHNLLTIGPNSTIKGIQNVTVLTMSHNKITHLDWIPTNLKVLNLDNNRLSFLEGHVLELINSSKILILNLENNPWRCDCMALNFSNYLREHHTEIKVDNIVCNQTDIPVFSLNRKDLCLDSEWSLVNTILIVVSFLLLVSISLALFYCYQQELKVWLFAKGWCMWWVTEEEIDRNKQYDAFISYSHKDDDFATENLVPVLESGPNPYKLCLHYRDWIPGEFITQQITNSVLNSRRTVVILSENFLESVWGKMEFRTAHTQAMTEGHARVIIILYGEVNERVLDPELQTYLKTNTYLKWGDAHFWEKLQYALPHSKHRHVVQRPIVSSQTETSF